MPGAGSEYTDKRQSAQNLHYWLPAREKSRGTIKNPTNISMKAVNIIAQVLLIIGGLNWLLVGLFDLDLVAQIFGVDSWFSNFVYILVGIAALWGIYMISPLVRGSEVQHHHHRRTEAVHTSPPPPR